MYFSMVISFRIRIVLCPYVYILLGGLCFNIYLSLSFAFSCLLFFFCCWYLLMTLCTFHFTAEGRSFAYFVLYVVVSLNKPWLRDQQLLIHMQSGLKSKSKYHDLSFIWYGEEMYARICICVLTIVELKNNHLYSKS